MYKKNVIFACFVASFLFNQSTIKATSNSHNHEDSIFFLDDLTEKEPAAPIITFILEKKWSKKKQDYSFYVTSFIVEPGNPETVTSIENSEDPVSFDLNTFLSIVREITDDRVFFDEQALVLTTYKSISHRYKKAETKGDEDDVIFRFFAHLFSKNYSVIKEHTITLY